VRMFVQFSLNAVAVGEPQEHFATFFTTTCCVIFPMHMDLGKSRADDRGVCLGYDDITKVPIGCSVTKDTLISMGVIHQWIPLFQKGGWSEVEDYAEVRIIKYPWQRDSQHSDIDCEHRRRRVKQLEGVLSGPALVTGWKGMEEIEEDAEYNFCIL